MALAVVALAVGACRAKEPALVLEFAGLPPDPGTVSAVTVELSSESWAFTGGNDVPSGSVTVQHVAGDRLLIGIEPRFLRDKKDRLRLGLTTPRALPVSAVATAIIDGRSLVATDTGTAKPGEDLVLHFLFGEGAGDGGSPGSDGPASDGARADTAGHDDGGAGDVGPDELGPPPPPPPDAAFDQGSPPPPPPDAGADQGSPPPPPPDALPHDGPSQPPPDGPNPPPPDGPSLPPDLPPSNGNCTPGPLRPISVSTPTTPATLQLVGPSLFAAVWPDLNRVLFNAVDAAGNLKHTSDVVSVTVVNDTSTIYRNPRMVVGGGKVFISYGRTMSGGNAGVPTRVLDPVSGDTSDSLVLNGPSNDGSAPELAGLAFGADLLLVSRAPGNGPTQARLDRININGIGKLALLGSQTPPSLSGTRAAALAWADQAQRYGVAALVDSSQRGGMMSTFTSGLTADQTFSFTPDGSTPVITGGGTNVSVAGARDRFAVAWIDARGCATCSNSGREVFLSLVNPANGSLLASAHVSTTGNLPKSSPHVAFDGTSYAVVWLESDGNNARVMFRRFDAALAPLDAAIDVSAGGPGRPTGDIDVVSDTRNGYGVLMTPSGSPHHFTHVTCTGP